MFADMKGKKFPTGRTKTKVHQYLEDLLDKKAFDQKGLIYGMGHAIYSVSDPRAEIFKQFVEQLAKEKGREEEVRTVCYGRAHGSTGHRRKA